MSPSSQRKLDEKRQRKGLFDSLADSASLIVQQLQYSQKPCLICQGFPEKEMYIIWGRYTLIKRFVLEGLNVMTGLAAKFICRAD